MQITPMVHSIHNLRKTKKCKLKIIERGKRKRKVTNGGKKCNLLFFVSPVQYKYLKSEEQIFVTTLDLSLYLSIFQFPKQNYRTTKIQKLGVCWGKIIVFICNKRMVPCRRDIFSGVYNSRAYVQLQPSLLACRNINNFVIQ